MARPDLLEDSPSWGEADHASSLLLTPLTDEAVDASDLEPARRAWARAGGARPHRRDGGGQSALRRGDRRDADRRGTGRPSERLRSRLGHVVADLPPTHDSGSPRSPARPARRPRTEPCSSEARSRARSFIAAPSSSFRRRATVRGSTAACDTLSQQELIQPGRADFRDEQAFRFRHQLLRDVAYESLSKTVRADLHERFARWLEEKTAERTEEFDEILGYHLQQAYRYKADLGPVDDHGRELATRAANRLGNAGLRAHARGDMWGASKLLSSAVALTAGERLRRAHTQARRRALRDRRADADRNKLGFGPLLLAPAARSRVGVQAARRRRDAAVRLLRQGQATSGPGSAGCRVHRLRIRPRPDRQFGEPIEGSARGSKKTRDRRTLTYGAEDDHRRLLRPRRLDGPWGAARPGVASPGHGPLLRGDERGPRAARREGREVHRGRGHGRLRHPCHPRGRRPTRRAGSCADARHAQIPERRLRTRERRPNRGARRCQHGRGRRRRHLGRAEVCNGRCCQRRCPARAGSWAGGDPRRREHVSPRARCSHGQVGRAARPQGQGPGGLSKGRSSIGAPCSSCRLPPTARRWTSGCACSSSGSFSSRVVRASPTSTRFASATNCFATSPTSRCPRPSVRSFTSSSRAGSRRRPAGARTSSRRSSATTSRGLCTNAAVHRLRQGKTPSVGRRPCT